MNVTHGNLSACLTATSRDLELLDESIHLASAILLVGYPSVIGSLWEVRDERSPEIAKDVYTVMLGQGEYLDIERSAEGLHWAVRRLREKTRIIPGFARRGPNDPCIWASYIHLGV